MNAALDKLHKAHGIVPHKSYQISQLGLDGIRDILDAGSPLIDQWRYITTEQFLTIVNVLFLPFNRMSIDLNLFSVQCRVRSTEHSPETFLFDYKVS